MACGINNPEEKQVNKRITIMVGTRDRPTELALLLQSFRTNTYQEWDILVVDDASGTPIQNFHFIQSLCARLKIERHDVKIFRNNISFGVSPMRNQSAEMAIKHYPKNDLLLRIDDDTIAEPDFLQKLVDVIDSGYDLASGVTPGMSGPDWIRSIQHVKPIINRVVLDELGGFIINGDDCGMKYLESEILPTHHFRSTALYKKTIHTINNVWYETNLTKSGMREEEFFSFRIILAGLKLGVHTGAIHYHLMTPSGGQRTASQDNHIQNQKILNRWTKKKVAEKGNFIENYNKWLAIENNDGKYLSEYNKYSNLDKNTNFIMTKEE